jgi:beta-N-acetylhexosaminidase
MAKRSFGTTADAVAPMVESAVKGFLDGGIMCCAKHFPGIGGAQGDSETEAITTDKTLDQLRQEELVPFERAIAAGVPMVMVGHISCPKVTGDSAPASLSRAIVTDVLRDELGFGGIIITDSLGMGAVAGLHKARDLAVAAIQAGVDMLLMTPDLAASYQGVLNAVKAGTITEERIDESVTRIVRAKLALRG